MSNLDDLVFSLQNRGKLFTWSEAFSLSGHIPTQIQSHPKLSESKDPSVIFTESGKNYSVAAQNRLLTHYSNPKLFKTVHTKIGVATTYVAKSQDPKWADFMIQNDWYWKQKKICGLGPWLSCIPGVKEIYLGGSVMMQVSKQMSDIDLIFITKPKFVLVTRLWAKFIFKIAGVDVHPFHLEFYLRALRFILTRFTFLSEFRRSEIEQKILKIQSDMWNYKHTSRIKLDIGLICESLVQIQEYFPKEDRMFSLLSINKVWPLNPRIPQLSTPKGFYYIGYCEYLPVTLVKRVFIGGLRVLLSLVSYITFPLAVIQLLWHRVQPIVDINHTIAFDFCCFYPKYPLQVNLVARDTYSS